MSSAGAPERPLVVWDGSCGFCRMSIERLQGELGERVETTPYQEVGDRFAPLGAADYARAVHLIEPDGRRSSGAEAVFRALAYRDGGLPWLALYLHLPGFGLLADLGYRFVARHRGAVRRIAVALVGEDLRPLRHDRVRFLYLRALGVVALCAALSLAVQIDGLTGSGGIQPVGEYLGAVERGAADAQPWLELPTLLWLAPGDTLQRTLAWAAVALALAVLLDVAPGPALLALWAVYLSLCNAAGVFFAYQWDALLLETLLASALFAPWRLAPRPPWRARADTAPPLAALWLLRLLLFKLLLLSGLVKLTSGDPTWSALTALQFHFESQPLPTWSAYWMHQLPAPVLALACAAVLALELGLPWLMLAPRRPRALACAGTLGLMLAIGSTGNYGFFDPLTAVLALALLDDRMLAWLPARLGRVAAAAGRAPGPRRRALAVVALAAWLALSAAATSLVPDSAAARALGDLAARFHLASRYGLFARMTVGRGEIAIEGSRDGRVWTPYAFRWKPDALERAGRFSGPHMPRLDWQLWFASLQGCAGAPWLLGLAEGLLEARPAVRSLLASDPFGAEPPRELRMTIAAYAFTDLAERRRTGHFWKRGSASPFCPVFTLRGGELALAEPRVP
jgi:lipase maturation factor 1